ncbi:MAG: gliding motility protein GldL [Agriterribacter sp.]
MAGTNKTTEKLVNVFVCVGAAVVIFGAWAKILHKPIADMMLTVGLLTEAVIFLVYAFLPPPGGEMKEIAESLKGGGLGVSGGNPALASMDKMLQDAAINPTNLQRLGENFSKFGLTVEKMADIADVTAATADYTTKTKAATQALDQVKDAYLGAANTAKSFNEAADSTKQFHSQVQTLTKNLSSLNTIYELELQDTNNHLKAMNGFYSNLVQASQTMQGSVEDAKKTQEQISLLAKNLGSLNNVYGNMLAAMQGR